ncbi:OprD family porin [Pseudomonas helleri]|uniref:OprD family porin n=1 Tax=Pseudomonas helleri TaxID=1608996 RepID=UPI003F9CCF37
MRTSTPRAWATLGLCTATLPFNAHADFLSDSKATLEARNFYFNRDFKQHDAPQNQATEWAQGFLLKFESGFTDGPVGVGIDAMGQMGLKLDSSPDRHGTGLLPYGASGRAPDSYSELGLTAKARYSQTVLKAGTLQPQLPVAAFNDTRLLPSTYTGELITSKEINGLTLNLGRLEKQNLRDSSSNDGMSYAGVETSHLDLAGGSFALTPNLTTSYYHARMKDIYSQDFVGLVHEQSLADGVSLRSDLRYFATREDGEHRFRSATRVDGGRIDNRFFNGMESLSVGGHRFGVGYQNLSGRGDFAYPGLDPYSVNLVTINVFTKAETDAWQLRYDYNFAAMGVPGLTFMTRYVSGSHIDTAKVSGGTERERDTDFSYVVQSGPLKNVSFRLRNATLRSGSGLTTDINETRLIVGYNLSLW